VPSTPSERALTYLGLRPPSSEAVTGSRSRLDRIGTPGPDSSRLDLVIGIAFLAVLIVAWVSIVVSDTNIAIRVLCAIAIPIDLLMIGARVRDLMRRGA
jgi:hypothetical protein